VPSKALTEGNASIKCGRESTGENSPSKGSMKQGSNGNNCMEEEDTIMASNEEPTEKMAPRALTYNEDSTMAKNRTSLVNKLTIAAATANTQNEQTTVNTMSESTSKAVSSTSPKTLTCKCGNGTKKKTASEEIDDMTMRKKGSLEVNASTEKLIDSKSMEENLMTYTKAAMAIAPAFEIPKSIQAGVQIVDAFPFEPEDLEAIQDEVLPTKPNKSRTYDVAHYQVDPKSLDTARTPYKGHFGEGKDYAHDDINRILCFMAPIVKGEPVDGGLALKPEYAPTTKQAIKIVGATLLNQLPEEFLKNHGISIKEVNDVKVALQCLASTPPHVMFGPTNTRNAQVKASSPAHLWFAAIKYLGSHYLPGAPKKLMPKKMMQMTLANSFQVGRSKGTPPNAHQALPLWWKPTLLQLAMWPCPTMAQQ
jgi:hypothetical protein